MERALFKAKTAENLEKYEDVVANMKVFVENGGDIHVPEHRNLLSVGYKNMVGTHRNAWRAVCSLEMRASQNDVEREVLREYKEKVVKDICDVCSDAVDFIKEKLLGTVQPESNPESVVFYHKMVGDYFRYMAEVKEGDSKDGVVKNAQEAYQKALEIAEEKLQPTDPVKLGLALNFSVFYYEIVQSHEKACGLAKKAFDDGISGLDELSESGAYKDSTLIMQLLRDNLTLWTSETEEKEDNDKNE